MEKNIVTNKRTTLKICFRCQKSQERQKMLKNVDFFCIDCDILNGKLESSKNNE